MKRFSLIKYVFLRPVFFNVAYTIAQALIGFHFIFNLCACFQWIYYLTDKTKLSKNDLSSIENTIEKKNKYLKRHFLYF